MKFLSKKWEPEQSGRQRKHDGEDVLRWTRRGDADASFSCDPLKWTGFIICEDDRIWRTVGFSSQLRQLVPLVLWRPICSLIINGKRSVFYRLNSVSAVHHCTAHCIVNVLATVFSVTNTSHNPVKRNATKVQCCTRH